MVCQENSSSSSTMKTTVIIEEEATGDSKRVPSSVIETADILLRVAKYRDRRTAAQLVDLLSNISFDLNSLRWYIKSAAYCKDVII